MKNPIHILFVPVFTCMQLFYLPFSDADIVPSVQVDIYAAKMGLTPDMDTYRQDPRNGLTFFSGAVAAPCKLRDLGFCDVKEGDKVEVVSLKDGQWKIKILSTEQEKIFPLRIEWNEDD